MNKQPQVTERTRAALRDAFWSLYAGAEGVPGLPVERIPIRAITDRAGYNRATFYLYYRDVYDLLGQIEDELLEGVRELVQDHLMGDEELDFHGHMELIVRLTQQGRGHFAVLLGAHGDPAFAVRLKRVLRPLVNRFLVTDPGLDDVRRDLLGELYLSGLLAAVTRWFMEAPEMPVEDFVELVAGALLP